MTTLHYPLATEKSIRLMETDNTLIFIVENKATKQEIKQETEKLFNTKVTAVRTHKLKGQKRAYITFHNDTPAIDIATDLGVL